MSHPPTTQVFTVTGMDCAHCAQTVEQGVAQLAGVTQCDLQFATEKLRVEGQIPAEQVIQRIRELGYDVRLPDSPRPEAAPTSFGQFLWSRRETRFALVALLLVLPGLVIHELLHWELWWVHWCSLAAMVLAGYPVALSAWRSLWFNRQVTINALMTIAALGAVLIGATTEAGMVMVLFALGEALEGYTGSKARATLRSMLELAPHQATRLLPQGSTVQEQLVPVQSLQIGDLIVVRPGERVPMDGVVVAGASTVNQAPITGESQLVEKAVGSELFAGSINGEGSLELQITHLAEDTTISRMIQLVEQAQERRSATHRLIDQFAKYYTPAVVLLAVLVAVIPPLLWQQPFWNPSPDQFGWLYRALALLVIACPCALVISTPVTIISALSAAARHGVLIKGGVWLERLSQVQVVAFDKTGTLTAGKPQLVEWRAANCRAPESPTSCDACDDLLALAYAVERRSEHPLAQAIVSASLERGLTTRYPPAEQVTALVGQGVNGQVADQQVLIGSHRLFDATIPHDQGLCAQAHAEATRGLTPVMVSINGTYRGMLTLADQVRATSHEAITALRLLGMRAVVMLTGDQQATAERIAQQLGVTEVYADLLPADKLQRIEDLQQRYGPVAMVGDGVNDAPALARAHVGVAIGAAYGGTTQAMETADVTLMHDDLRQLAGVIRLSRQAVQTIRVNIALSIGIKLVFLLITLLGFGTMWMAVLADVGTSLLVTLYGMRLLRWQP